MILVEIALGQFVFSLVACGVSKEVRNVIEKIDSIEEITLESGAMLDEIESAYDALSDKEKQQVNNLSTFEEARTQYGELLNKQKNESILDDLNTRLTNLSQLEATKKEDISSAIKEIERQYLLLDEDYKEQATMYSKLDSYVAQSVKRSVKSLTEVNTLAAASMLEEYKDYLSDDDIMLLLGEIGLNRCVDDAINNLKRINSGKVYDVTSINVSCVGESGNRTSYQNGENRVEGTLSISGTNYFGGPYEQEIYMYYTFSIDVEKCSVSNVDGLTF